MSWGVLLMGILWDVWQREVLETQGNIVVCSGRQVGKSEIVAKKVCDYIVAHPKHGVLIVSVTEDQAELMLQKILGHLHDVNKKLIARGLNKPTKHKVTLSNGAYAVTRALGSTAAGLRGGTYNVVVADECAYFSAAVWQVLTPMILTTNGSLWLLSTPNAMEGFFYEAYVNADMGFKAFHVNSEEVADKRPEPQRSIMLAYLEREKVRMSKLEYSTQYLANFCEEISQLFPDKLIKDAQVLERSSWTGGEVFIGVDYAAMGGDLVVMSVFEKKNGKYYQRESLSWQYIMPTETNLKLLELDSKWNAKAIYIDSGGSGIALADFCMYSPRLKNKTVQVDNATRSITPDNSRKRKLLKEDLYMNALSMLDRGEVQLLTDADIFTSFKSVQIEHDVSKADVKIHSRFNHHVESCIRALWANHNTRLSLWAR